jgi:hypothetical protein
VRSPEPVTQGLFGMAAFHPQPGAHRYALVFEGSGSFAMIACMFLSLAALAVTR